VPPNDSPDNPTTAEKAPAPRRKSVGQRVREARDQLTSTTGTRATFDYELVRQFADNRVSAVFLNGHNVGFSYAGPTGTGDAYTAFSDQFTISNPAFFKDGLNQLQFLRFDADAHVPRNQRRCLTKPFATPSPG